MNTFFHHFQELKYRLWYLSFSFCLTFFISCFQIQPILYFVLTHLDNAHVVVTDVSEFWLTMISLSIYIAFFLTLPLLFYNLWSFFTPGLYQNEFQSFLNIILLHLFLLLISGFATWYIFLPCIIQFFLFSQTQSTFLQIECFPKLFPYILVVGKLLMVCFIVFQLPAIISILLKFNYIASNSFITHRKLAILIIVLFSAFISPPDMLSQLSISCIIFLFYELLVIYSICHRILSNLYKIKQIKF